LCKRVQAGGVTLASETEMANYEFCPYVPNKDGMLWPANVPFPVDEINADGVRRLEINERRGPGGGISKLQGLAVAYIAGEQNTLSLPGVVIFGDRIMYECREVGHDIAGKVSIGNSKYKAYTGEVAFLYQGRKYWFGVFDVVDYFDSPTHLPFGLAK